MANRKIDSLAAVIRSKYNRWNDARRSKELKWEQYYRTYRCIETPMDKTRGSERSMVKMPATKQAVDSAFDHIMRSVFGIDPFFDIEGRQYQDKIPAEILKQYISYLFYKENFARKYGMCAKEMLIYGTCVGRVTANTVRESKVVMEDMVEAEEVMDEFGEIDIIDNVVGQEAVMEYKDVNRPEFRPVSVYDFFPDPMASDCHDGEGVILRAFPSYQKLRQMERQGQIKGVGLLEDDAEAAGKTSSDQEAFKRRLSYTGIQPQAEDSDKNPMTLEYWGWLEKDVLKEAGYSEEIYDGGAEVTAIVCGNTTLKLIANPFVTRERPFFKCCYEELPGEFWGMGICEATEGPQRALDAAIRSRLDNKALSVNTMWGINTRRMVPGQNMSCYPGKIWLTNGPIRDAIEQFKVDDVTTGTSNEAVDYERYIQEGARISKALGGQPVKRGEMSATESQGLNMAQNVRIINVVDNLERNMLQPILKWYYHIILQFLEVPDEIIVTQEQQGIYQQLPLLITPDKLSGDFDFIPMGAARITDQQMIVKVRDFMQQVGSSPILQQMVNMKLLIEKNYKLIFGAKDIDQMFQVDPQQQQALMMAQGMQQQGSPPKLPSPPSGPGGGQ